MENEHFDVKPFMWVVSSIDKVHSISKRFFFLFLLLLFVFYGLSAQKADSVLAEKLIELRGVEVIGQRLPSIYKNLARKVSILTQDDIQSSNASTIQDLLENVGGIDIRQRNVHGVQADIQLRGGSFDQVMVLLNGVNLTDPQTGHFTLDLPVELSSVERIEILHGSGARLYGPNAFKGVINIITKNDKDYLTLGVENGQHRLLHTNLSAGLKTGRLFNSISLSRIASGGYSENTDYRISHFFYQGGLTLGKGNILWQGGVNAKAFGANDFYSPVFPEQYEETSGRFGSLGFNTKGKVSLSIVGYWRRHNDHFLLKRYDPSFYENFHQTDVYGIRGNVNFSSIIGKTSLGFEARSENILSSRLGNDLIPPVRIKGMENKFYTSHFERGLSSYFLEHNYVTEMFSITGGFLVSDNSSGRIDIFPGLDFSYNLYKNKVKLFASVNRSLRLPTFTDLFYKDPSNEGNRNLLPEKLIALETGAEYILKNISTNITIFHDHGKQVIDWVWEGNKDKYNAMNIAEIVTRGIEVSASYRLSHTSNPLEIREFGISYSGIDLTKSTGEYVSKYSLDFLRHKLTVHLNYGFTKSISALLQVGYNSRNGSYLDYNQSNGAFINTPLKPYSITDLSINYTTQVIRLYIKATNLLDKEFTDVGSLIQAGRWITIGVQFIFSKTQ